MLDRLTPYGSRVATYRSRIVRELRAAVREEHTPHEVGGSFAIGIFVTAMPTGGLGIGLFFLLVAISDRISKIAIFSSVLVLNPIIKPTVYVASLTLGNWLLGGGAINPDGSLGANAVGIVLRLIVGNLVIAIVFAVIGYVTVYYFALAYQRRGSEIAATVAAEVVRDAERAAAEADSRGIVDDPPEDGPGNGSGSTAKRSEGNETE